MVKIAELAAELSIIGAEKARAELRSFKADVLDSGEKLDQAGRKMTSTGQDLQRKLTVPLVLAGGAALKMSLDYDTSFTKIQGLVGVAADEVEKMKAQVTALSGETARAPVELAEALFTVTSAGFRGHAAMDVLSMAAKGAAVGMGETRTIAETLTASVSAYGPEVLDAAKATDILVATVRAGNFEAPQLAASLGTVLPVASAMGVKFEDIGGSVALMTRSNNNASKSITQINALLTAMVKPSAIATEILGAQGLTMSDVRDAASGPGGLVEALGMLDDAVGGDEEALAQLLGSTEANSAALTILNADAGTIADTFGAVADSTGTANEAFAITAESSSFAARQGFAEMQAAALQFAEIMLPTALQVIEAVSGIAQAFSDLPGPMQNLVTLGIVAAAAGGPVLRLAGSVTTMAGSMVAARKSGESMTKAMLGGLSPATIGVTAAAAGALWVFAKWRADVAETAANARELADALSVLSGDFDAQTDAALRGRLEAHGVMGTFSELGFEVKELHKSMAGGTDEYDDLAAQLKIGTAGYDDIRKKMLEAEGGASGYTLAILAAGETGEISRKEAIELASAIDDLADSYDEATGPLRDNLLATIDMLDAETNLSGHRRMTYIELVNEADTSEDLLEIKQQLLAHAEAYGVVLGDEASATADFAAEQFDAALIVEETTEALQDQTSALDTLLGATVGLWGADIRVEEQQARTRTAVANYNETLADGTKTSEDAEKARLGATKAVLSEVDAVLAAAAAQAELDGATLTASDQARIQADALSAVAATLAPGDPLRSTLLGYIGDLGKIPTEILTDIDTAVDPEGAAEAERLLNDIARSRLAVIGVSYTGGGTIGKAGTPTIAEAQGGIVIPMAQGGILGERGVSQIADSGANVLFAEEGKGRESYVAWNDQYRDRSLGIMHETADHFDHVLTPKGETGGTVDNSTTNNFELTVIDRSNTDVSREFERMQVKAALQVGV